MEVEEIKLGNALFNRNLKRSLFFVGEPIQICMRGKFRRNVPSGLQRLQSSVHGDVKLVGDIGKIISDFTTRWLSPEFSAHVILRCINFRCPLMKRVLNFLYFGLLICTKVGGN